MKQRGLVLLLLVLACLRSPAQKSHSETFLSAGHAITYEVFGDAVSRGPVLILLPGTSGPEASLYRSQAAFFAQHGYTTLLLHYFDAASSHLPSTATYQAWVSALADLVQTCSETPAYKGDPLFVVGYSLGASVAVAAGSQELPVNGIADWYGSLPDAFFFRLKGMPPLLILHGALDSNIPVVNANQLIRLCQMAHFDCTSHIYPNENHGFAAPALADADQRTLEFFRTHQH